jgi:hypothetical protein
MNIKDFLDNPDSQKYEVKTGLAFLRILDAVTLNQTLLTSILRKQIEIQEQLKGLVKSEIDDDVELILKDILTLNLKHSDERYMTLVRQVVDFDS